MKTKSELLFEEFLAANNLRFARIEEAETPRPDYTVATQAGEIIFELKELLEDDRFGVIKDPDHPEIRSHSRTMGAHVRRRIEGSRRQIQYGASQNVPTVLLIYNAVDPVFQAFGTEPHDFISAMYGSYTKLINRETMAMSDWFNGKGQMLQENKNTSFSAVGHLCDRGRKTTLTLYENVFARVKIAYDQLPQCFQVTRVNISTEPLAIP